MNRAWLSHLGLLVALAVCPTTFGQDTYTLGFDGADVLKGSEGGDVEAQYTCTLNHEGPGPGAQGWSISVTADNARVMAIQTGIGVDSALTTAATVFNGGFEKTETTTDPTRNEGDCAGQDQGAVSAIVLSFTMPLVLPPNSMSTLAIVDLGATIPPGDGMATLRYANGCRGAGQKVENNVTQEGATVPPVLVAKEINLVVDPNCCGALQNLGFSATALASSLSDDGFADDSLNDDGEPVCFGTGSIEGKKEVDVYAGLSTGDANLGIQGWSLSIEAMGDVDVIGVTTTGTSGGSVADGGKQNGGFEKTEIVDPNDKRNAGRRGCTTAVVLSFTMPITLDVPGTESVLKMTVGALCADGFETCSGEVQFRNGLAGAGEPVNNVITVAGSSGSACNFNTDTGESLAIAAVTIIGIQTANYLRGDSNNDNRVDIADPIWTISELFRSGPASTCQAAADANGDNMVDLGDAVYTLAYRFQNGPTPPAPFPDCGEVVVEDGDLSCEVECD